MNITKVSIRHVDMNKVKAIASITIDDDFVVHDLRVVEGERGLFVAMPSRKLPSGNFRDVAHPINSETRETVQSMVLDEYKSSLESIEDNPVSADAPHESDKPSFETTEESREFSEAEVAAERSDSADTEGE
jgi:stage V sporulation protein G